MESKYHIVNTSPNDLEMICWMFEEAIAYQKRNNYKGWDSYDKAFLENEISKLLQFKIVENKKILCIFSVCFNDPLIWREKDTGTSIYLHRITVNPKFKGQKQFKKVLNWAIEYAYKNKLDTIRMDTWAENTTIIDYYKSYGFQFLENYKTANTKELPIQHRNLNVALLEYKVKPIAKTNDI
ncbi:GNAT family N-acetyltransferase [Flavobacterium sp. 5]|uniref:GNAT family N-acetyltransferase n=1 Tax=Flavobacterium sp. 5 TaxID=2035199 RepID=UPI000C2C125A|nr:GNAT family N-acetyltransferase [Flavobacterium sp. 5]PKB15101.1 ribosomal protein S18 acetylase RimI-like enzyme [Flavobacterium sp. 5]